MNLPAERHNLARGDKEWADTYGNLGNIAQAQLTQLPLVVLDDWAGAKGDRQPFRSYTQEKLEELAENIRKNGVIEPIHARPRAGGRFEIIAGHNRCAAARLAGLTTVPALVQPLDDAQAAILLVDSNLQHREKLLPSEKAFAYKLRLESLKRQGHRSDLTSDPLGPKSGPPDSGALPGGGGPDGYLHGGHCPRCHYRPPDGPAHGLRPQRSQGPRTPEPN